MKRNILTAVLVLPVVCLLIWITFLSVSLSYMHSIKVVIKGYDPRDLLSGRYIAYQIDWDKTDCTQFYDHICPKEEFCRESRWGRQCRFYVPETRADSLNELFQSGRENGDIFEVIYAYKKGYPPIGKALLINGRDWYEVVSEKRL